MSFRRKPQGESAQPSLPDGPKNAAPVAQQGQILRNNRPQGEHAAPVPVPPVPKDAAADDLVRRVMAAIDEWARANGLSALPRHIFFQQALSVLNAIDRNFPSED